MFKNQSHKTTKIQIQICLTLNPIFSILSWCINKYLNMALVGEEF